MVKRQAASVGFSPQPDHIAHVFAHRLGNAGGNLSYVIRPVEASRAALP